MKLAIININRSPETREGCSEIAACIREMKPDIHLTITHWEEKPWPHEADKIILGPNEDPFPAYPKSFQSFLESVRSRETHCLGICGGHQALALAFGGEVGPVFDIAPATSTYQGMARIDESVTVRLEPVNDPLVNGLAGSFELVARHVDHIRVLPEAFETLGHSPRVPHQIIRHRTRPLYGIQAHPERQGSGLPGLTLIRNFLDMAS